MGKGRHCWLGVMLGSKCCCMAFCIMSDCGNRMPAVLRVACMRLLACELHQAARCLEGAASRCVVMCICTDDGHCCCAMCMPDCRYIKCDVTQSVATGMLHSTLGRTGVRCCFVWCVLETTQHCTVRVVPAPAPLT